MDSRKLFLIQSYLDDWKIYQDILNQKSSLPFWDLCILTASNQDQAKAYRLQIDTRIDSGLLPKQTKFIILPDPDGKRIGSGGATLYALHEASKSFKSESSFDGKRILIIHSGGDSKRIPHNSIFGKIFSKIPRELPNGCSSTLFDETFITLSGLPSRMKDGVMVISGDVLLIFNHTQLDFERMGVIGISIKTDVKTGSQHGVYVEDPFTKKVKYFFHKNPENKLKEFGAIDENEMVRVDTGMIWFDPKVASCLLNLVNNYPTEKKENNLRWWMSESLGLNLYGDILYPLAQESTLKEYFDQASEMPKTEMLFQARQVIWNELRNFPFYVLTPYPAQFIHFGTTKEYLALVLNGTKDYRDFGWKNKILSFCSRKNRYHTPSFHSFLSTSSVPILQKVIFEDCEMKGGFTVGKNSLLSNIRYQGERLNIDENTVVQTIPLKNNKYITRIYGVFDNPKNSIEEGTYLNRPWKYWFKETNIMPEDIWDNSIEATNRTLWNAKLFPVCNSRDESLESILWLQNPETITKQQVTHWLGMQRVSLKESMEYADHMRILRDQKEIEDRIRAELFFEAIRNKRPVLKSINILGNELSSINQQVDYLIKKTEKTSDPLERMRYYRALAEVTKIYPHPCYPYNSKELEEMAFQELNELINTHIEKRNFSPNQNQIEYQWARVKIAARADLGGGWSDTPPFCNEYGGTVLNCALTLNHSLPIEVYIRRINEPFLIFKSIDLGLEKTISSMEELIIYKNPSDPLALHKAALFFSGFIPEDIHCSLKSILGKKGGLEFVSSVNIPKGSGLGTSSIIAAAMLIGLTTLFGKSVEERVLFEMVLGLEQKLTTGGGWQDQVGGIVPGIKLITTKSGFPQYPQYQPILLSQSIKKKFDEHYAIIYTGQKRLAKNILRDMMSSYILAEPVTVRSLHAIKDIALKMVEALSSGDFSELGKLMSIHWKINKKMDPGCSNLFIDQIFKVCSPYIYGGKLCGAGGGGFMEVILKDPKDSLRLNQILGKKFPGRNVSIWPAQVTDQPILIEKG